MNRREEILEELGHSREMPPPGFVDRVMAALPDRPALTWRERLAFMWPEQGRWLVPAAAGALATLLAAAGLWFVLRDPAGTISVTFDLLAPEAEQVELVGSFTDWRPGAVVLEQRTAGDSWTVTVELPAGRHEYIFLVNGEHWITDPKALVVRPDGFGNENAILEI